MTALYEIVPKGVKVDVAEFNESKFQKLRLTQTNPKKGRELLTVKLKYKKPREIKSNFMERSIIDQKKDFREATPDFQFAASVASFGMLLRDSKFEGISTFDRILEAAIKSKGVDKGGYRAEFIAMVKKAQGLSGKG